jgi:exosome complex RNA-binding protein Rrp4
MEVLPPAPVDLPPPPEGASTFDVPPLAVLPGDDLTRYIQRKFPPSSSSAAVGGGGRKKKSRLATTTASTPSSPCDDDESPLPPPKIGTGLSVIRRNDDTYVVRATVAGRLVCRPSSRTWYVASNPRRYHPTHSPLSSTSLARITSSSSSGGIASNCGVGDRVIGIVEDQRASSDYYRINIYGSHPALLHVLSFEGATKRNRPQLDPGALVYCRVVRGFGGGRMDPEVSCKVGGGGGGDTGKSAHNCDNVDEHGDDDDDGGAARKDWMTNEGTYGPLVGGTSFRVPLGLSRELLLPRNAVLDALDKSGMPFEIAIGTNGVVWVNSPEPSITIMIVNAIRNSEVMAEDLVRGMVKVMVKNVKRELND